MSTRRRMALALGRQPTQAELATVIDLCQFTGMTLADAIPLVAGQIPSPYRDPHAPKRPVAAFDSKRSNVTGYAR